MTQRNRVVVGGAAIVATAIIIGGALHFFVMRPALEIQGHKKALEEAAALAREKRHSLPSDADLYEFKQHVDALVELGHYEEREFQLPMNALSINRQQLFRELERQAQGLPVWDWKPTLEKDAIVITVRAKPADMKRWESIIGRYG